MSYDKSIDRNRRAAKNWQDITAPSHETILEDVERGAFLRQLCRADFDLTAFEAAFVESFFADNSLNWWTPGRREVCDCLCKTYGGRL